MLHVIFVLYTILCAAGWLLTYVNGSIGLVRLAKKEGAPRPWLGAVPVLRLSVLGRLKPEISVGPVIVRRPELVLPLSFLVIAAVSRLCLPWVAEILFLFFWYATCKTGFFAFQSAGARHPRGIMIGSFFFLPVFYYSLFRVFAPRQGN